MLHERPGEFFATLTADIIGPLEEEAFAARLTTDKGSEGKNFITTVATDHRITIRASGVPFISQ